MTEPTQQPPHVEPLPPATAALDAPSPIEPQKPLLARLAGVFFSPRATFASVAARPSWAGPLAVYLVLVAAAALTYALRVDWELWWQGYLDESVAWKMVESFIPDEQLDQAQRAPIQAILDTGTGGMALQATLQSILFGVLSFHFMGILFATLFYLMGSLGNLRLGRVYLHGFLGLLALVGYWILQAIVNVTSAGNVRAALPFQAGLNVLFLFGYAVILRRAVEAQEPFKRLMSGYAHALAVPGLAALVSIAVMLIQSGPVTASGDEVLRSNLGAILGIKGTGALAALLGSLDVFRLWLYAAAAAAFAAVSGLSRGSCFAITFLPWGFATMLRVAVALVFGG